GYAGRATFVFAVLVAVIVGGIWVYRRLREEQQRERLMAWFDRQGRRPALRPAATVIRPLWRHLVVPGYRVSAPRVRFLWHRITPGDLGLELTTALAVSGVGLYVFTAYTVHVKDHLGPTAFDSRVLDFTHDAQVGFGVHAAKVVTALGSLPVTGPLVAIAAALLAVRRRPVELIVLVLSVVAIYVAVHVTKGAIGRPRPPDPLTGSSLSAFPSGHAAYSTVYVALAVIAARVMGVARGATLVTAGVLMAAAIGASRAYLRVHWYSDVLSGWALGAAIFGLLAAAGVVVGYFRNNGGAEPVPAVPGEAATDRA
ncbi:MAG: hypothetical protein QOC95_392, partial [Thermoleophilaceae bacterium]|nr:hypothetical protein [Thermoleophilaceae bacterium]